MLQNSLLEAFIVRSKCEKNKKWWRIWKKKAFAGFDGEVNKKKKKESFKRNIKEHNRQF